MRSLAKDCEMRSLAKDCEMCILAKVERVKVMNFTIILTTITNFRTKCDNLITFIFLKQALINYLFRYFLYCFSSCTPLVIILKVEGIPVYRQKHNGFLDFRNRS